MDEKNVRGQIAMWVIVAIILVAAVILFFLIDQAAILSRGTGGASSSDVQSYLRQCSTGFVNDVVNEMLPQGGFVEPKNYKLFNDIKVEYICKNIGYYEPCIQQHPLLIREMENEIKARTEQQIEKCFEKMKEDFENGGSRVDMDNLEEYKVDLQEDNIVLIIKRKISIERNGETRRGEDYEVQIPSPAYNLAKISAEIADQEAIYCYFEFVGFSIIYPRYEIDKYTFSDSTHIYTVRDLRSDKEMNIAIRGCAIQVGV